MLTKIVLKDFRVFEEFRLEGLGKITVITGRNNVGKTTILEAVYLASAAFLKKDNLTKKDILESILSRRGGTKYPASIIRYYDSNLKPRITLEIGQKELTYVYAFDRVLIDISKFVEGEYRYYIPLYEQVYNERREGVSISSDIRQKIMDVLKIHSEVLWSTIFLDSYTIKDAETIVSKFWAQLKFTREDKKVVEFINDSFGLGAESISYVPINGVNQLILEFPDHSIRLVDLGDGIKYSVMLYAILTSLKPKLVLIDNVESYLHAGGLRKIAKVILDYSAKTGAQFIMTTHSMEFIEELLRVAKEKGIGPDEITVFHLLRKGDKIISRRYDFDEAYRYAFMIGRDLRMP